MIQFEAKFEKVKEWFPETYNMFLEELRQSKSQSSDKKEEDIHWGIAWGFFSAKAKTPEEELKKQIDYENKLKLTYEERCAVDLTKLRVSISMKAGYYIRSDRSIDKELPQYIIDLHYDIMKVTMLEEQIILKDPVVMESLAPYKHLLDELISNSDVNLDSSELEIMSKTLGDLAPKLDMDDILDKISKEGMQSLSAKELKFLEKMSKG